MKKLSIILPVFNEEKTIESILERIARAELPSGIEKEVIIIDDRSTDSTRSKIENHRGQGNHKKIYLEKNRGKGGAVKEGLRHATGDYAIIQDADLEYDPAEYALLASEILEGRARSVFGSRNINERNQPVGKSYLYGGIALTKAFNMIFGTNYTDINTCYKLFPSVLFADIISCPDDSFTFDAVELTHIIARHGSVVEIPITYTPRKITEGKKIKYLDGAKMLARMIVLKTKSVFSRN